MRIAFCTPSLDPKFGGPARSVPQLAVAVAAHGHEVALWSPPSGPAMLPDGARRLTGAFPAALNLWGAVDVVHDNGLWSFCHHQIARTCTTRQIRRVVSPRGMLEPWALGQKRWKKRLAGWFYQNRDLRSASCLHATSQMEVDSIRSAGFRNPIALIPNGVEMPPASALRPPPSIINHQSSTINLPPRTALFLSRIHPKKGLLNLISAWAIIRNSEFGIRISNNWRLVIVGPDEGGHLAEVRRAVADAGLQGQIEFPGEAWGEARWQFYRDADLFVLPTFSENFGLVIAEALACRVPVITTHGAPWKDLDTRQCGWWIETGVDPLVAALKQAMATSPSELHAMGERGRTLVTERYSWDPIGRQMAEVYRWLVGGGPPPDCVQTSS